jgi:prepilin-type N-terminal cleavage/methylation domain-containing protein/prepilin-type processing-associated H-X9-DG protein
MTPFSSCNPSVVRSSENAIVRRRSRAFTLIELLTVIAVVAILATILLSAVGKIKERADLTRCSSNLRQLSVAALAYANENGGKMMALGNFFQKYNPDTGEWETEYDSWGHLMKSYLEEGSWDARTDNRLQVCPAAYESFGYPENGVYRSYAINFDGRGWKEQVPLVNFSCPERTVLFMDAALDGTDGDCYGGFSTSSDKNYLIAGDWRHGGKINTVFLDGHVESFTKSEEDLEELETAIKNWGK